MATGELEEGREGAGGDVTSSSPRRPDDPRCSFERYQLKTDPGLAQLEERTYIPPPHTPPLPTCPSPSCLGVEWNTPLPATQLINSNNEQQGMVMGVKWTTDGWGKGPAPWPS